MGCFLRVIHALLFLGGFITTFDHFFMSMECNPFGRLANDRVKKLEISIILFSFMGMQLAY